MAEITREALCAYCEAHPGLEITDVLKYIHQSCFGCAHLVAGYDAALEQIRREAAYAGADRDGALENLPGDYCRLHLKVLDGGLSAETLTKLFILSAEKRECPSGENPSSAPEGGENVLPGTADALRISAVVAGVSAPNEHIPLKNALRVFIDYASENGSPFDETAVKEEISLWERDGFSPRSHSDGFKALYHPAYRVIKKEYAPLIPLLTAIDRLLAPGNPVTVAIDGRCASGKTTLAETLSRLYCCNVFHTDDFFLRPGQRTPERLNTPGGNVDYERFESEVLLPTADGKPVSYRRYDCHSQSLLPPEEIPFLPLTVVEGSYSLHPVLRPYYALKILLDITPEEQRKRISRRNTPAMARRFFEEWIPLEERYFTDCRVRDIADTVTDTSYDA